jgi:hypothetical protein
MNVEQGIQTYRGRVRVKVEGLRVRVKGYGLRVTVRVYNDNKEALSMSFSVKRALDQDKHLR